MAEDKLRQASDDLKAALQHKTKALKDRFYFAGISKTFEVAFEYAWKALRAEVVASGLDAPSPRDAIKQAGKIGMLDNVELWLEFLSVRNSAVHDYLGITADKYLQTIEDFYHELSKLRAANAIK
jgi:nucleotidyltransferase substrate binding protein (TIGR01987 family)